MVQYNCDANENPTTYRGKTLTWTRGRLLETCPSLTSPNVTWTFTYNADGIRVGKSAPGVTTTYGVDGERIVYEKTNGQVKRYFYDESGIAGFEYDGQKYIFRKNLQGDVTGIYDMSGTLVGEYEYDAWGNLLNEPESDVLLWGPFRYRGYYYDASIGLYYLNSRYYDPETGRFLNEDLVSYLDPETLGGINPYAYCLNDPVNNIDPSGHSILLTFAIGALIGSITAFASSTIAQGVAYGWDNINWGVVGVDTLFGGIGGLISVSPIGAIGQMVIGGFSSALNYGIDQTIRGENVSWLDLGKSFSLGFFFGAGDGLLYGSMGKNGKTSILRHVAQLGKNALTLGVNKGLGSGLKYLSKTLFKQYWKEYILDSARIAGVTIGIDLLNTLVEYIKELLI